MDDATPADSPLSAATGKGPYYISNTPRLLDGEVNYTHLPGERIAVTGHVYGGSGASEPLAGVMIEIWQADQTGIYHPEAAGDSRRLDPADLALRGHVLTDEQGTYRFTTIYPGYYPGRTRHIHVRASADGFAPLVTQIIVPPKPGDLSTPDSDPIARSLPAENRVTFSAAGRSDGVPTARFDFHLGRL